MSTALDNYTESDLSLDGPPESCSALYQSYASSVTGVIERDGMSSAGSDSSQQQLAAAQVL